MSAEIAYLLPRRVKISLKKCLLMFFKLSVSLMSGKTPDLFVEAGSVLYQLSDFAHMEYGNPGYAFTYSIFQQFFNFILRIIFEKG